MPHVVFEDATHSYRQQDVLYNSATGVVKRFSPRFDEAYWLPYKALESMVDPKVFKEVKKKYSFKSPLVLEDLEEMVDPKEFYNVKAKLKAQWVFKRLDACNAGTMYHLMKERSGILRGYEKNAYNDKWYKTRKRPLDTWDNYSLRDNLYELEDGFYPELLLWNDTHQLAGQADRVFLDTENNIRYADIDDYKTNDEIELTNRFSSMLPPIEHLGDCNFNHYSLQLSIYAWMLEQFGFTIRSLCFHHYREKYEVKYLKEEVEAVLNYQPGAFEDLQYSTLFG